MTHLLLSLLGTIFFNYNPLAQLANNRPLLAKSESLISDLKINKHKEQNGHCDRNFYIFKQECGENFIKFDLKTTKYYELLLQLNHLLLNDHLAYFKILFSTIICLIICISFAIITTKHLFSQYFLHNILLGSIILSCVIFPIFGLSLNVLRYLLNHFPSPIHYLNDFIRKSKFDSDFKNPLFYYSSESLKVIYGRGIELEKQFLDISKIEKDNSTNQKATLSMLLLLLLRHHYSNVSEESITHQEKRNQFIPLEEIEIVVVREGIFEDGLKSKVTSKNDKNGNVIDDTNVIIGQSCVSNEFVLDPITNLLFGEKYVRKKKIQDLSVILKSLHSRETPIFETIRPKLMHTKLMYKKLRALTNRLSLQ